MASIESSLSYSEYPHDAIALTSFQPSVLSSEQPRIRQSDASPDVHLLGNKFGRDIRVMLPKGSTVLERQLTEPELHDLKLQRIEGTQQFDNYEYPTTVLSYEIFDLKKDAIGNEEMYARVYMLGDHYKNGVGEEVPLEKTWSIKYDGSGRPLLDAEGNVVKEHETISYAVLGSTIFDPGKIHARLVKKDRTNTYQHTEKMYEKAVSDELHMRRMSRLQQTVFDRRIAAAQQPTFFAAD